MEANDKPMLHPGDAGQMLIVENTVLEALKPFRNGRTEALLVVLALTRVARQLLYAYPEHIVNEQLPVLTAFLQKKDLAGASDSPIWTPPDPLGRIM
jgi:hypothetical protein